MGDAYKQKLVEDAKKKKAEQQKQEMQRQQQLKLDQQKAIKDAKEKAEKSRLHKERVAKLKSKVAVKQKKKVSAQKATLDWHKRHEQYDKIDIAKRQQIEANRQKTLSLIDSPDKALQCLFERYGEDKAKISIAMMIKVITNILKHPKEEKYRKLNLQNGKIQATITTPLGALKFFEFLNFEILVKKDEIFPNDVLKQTRFLIYKSVNTNDCKQALLMLEKYSETKKTLIYDYVQKIAQDDAIDMQADDLYMALLYLNMVLHNIRISPLSQHLRVIEVNNAIFKT